MVYGAALERRFTRKSIEGSNPSPSAIFLFVRFDVTHERIYNILNMDRLTVKTYDRQAGAYDIATTDFWERFPETFIKEFSVSVAGDGQVLNIGSGPGRDATLLHETGLEVICLDASRTMTEMTALRGLKSVRADFKHIPFKDSVFDGVWAYTSLPHVPKTEFHLALREVRRVLRPGAVFGLGVIEGSGEGYERYDTLDEERWFSYYHSGELEALLERNDFSPEYKESFKPGTRNYLNFIARAHIK